MKALVYSRLPRQAYTIWYKGAMRGVGVHEVFDAVPGAWNILWLTSAPTLESLLDWDRPQTEFPTSLIILPLCVATALQYATPSETYGQLAEIRTPSKLLKSMRVGEPPALVQVYGDSWYAAAEENAKLFVSNLKNIVAVDFRDGSKRV